MPLFKNFNARFEPGRNWILRSYRGGPRKIFELQWNLVKLCLKWTFLVLCNVYTCFVVSCSWTDPKRSSSVHLLIAICLLIDICTVYVLFARDLVICPLGNKLTKLHRRVSSKHKAYEIAQRLCVASIFASLGIFLVFDTEGNRSRLVSFAGTFVILLFGFAFSKTRKKIRWRPVCLGVLIQYLFGIIIFRWPWGHQFVSLVEYKFTSFMNNTQNGSGYVYGYLVTGNLGGFDNSLYTMCFKTLPGIIFTTMWMSVLYHFGVTQKVIVKLGWLLEHILGTTASESIAAAANVALNMPEASSTVQSQLQHMTSSEIHAVMTSGFATISGNMFGAYVLLGTNASHLVFASLMSAPSALALSKLLYPETEAPRTLQWHFKKRECKNVLEAVVTGTCSGMQLMLKVMSNLIGFISLISILNFLPGWFGQFVGIPFISLKWFFGKILFPVALLIGVDQADAPNVAYLIGVNACFTNMAAYKIMSDMRRERSFSTRSEILATYAICGFCNLSSVGVAMSQADALEAERKSKFSTLLLRTFLTGTCACLMTACIAGSLILD